MKGFLKGIKYISVPAFLAVLVLLSMGCTMIDQDMNDTGDLRTNDIPADEIKLYIDAELDFYAPTMSMVPGLPLKGRSEADNTIQDLRYHWITEYGSFLSWGDDGATGELGSDFFNSGYIIYWTPLLSRQLDIGKEFEIILKLEDSDGITVLAEEVIIIKVTEEGFITKSAED